MPIKSSEIKDARPSIKAEARSEKDLFSADIRKGSINIRRGEGRTPGFALKYGEVQELRDLLTDISQLLDENQYDVSESLSDGYEAGSARYTPANPRGPRTPAVTAGDPTTSNETAQAEGTTPAAAVSDANVGTPAQVSNDEKPFG